MKTEKKKIVIVGDRILIKPVDMTLKTKTGLYLPDTVKAKEEVATGIVIDHGPGIPMADPSSTNSEPWKDSTFSVKYIPIQAEKGDHALFLKKASIEVNIDGEKYLIIPQAALLVLLKNEGDTIDNNPQDNQYFV